MRKRRLIRRLAKEGNKDSTRQAEMEVERRVRGCEGKLRVKRGRSRGRHSPSRKRGFRAHKRRERERDEKKKKEGKALWVPSFLAVREGGERFRVGGVLVTHHNTNSIVYYFSLDILFGPRL